MRLFTIIKWLFRKWQRTYLAGCALNAFLNYDAPYTFSESVRESRKYADALIAELDKEDK